MDERGLAQVRARLEDFAAEMFAGIPRSDQRATGLRYLRGLMLDGRRKSMQPMAERLGLDYQQFQQFLTSSTWDVPGVRRRLAGKAVELIEPQVWIVDDTGFPKNGKASACVARQYSGTLGKVANCQVAVSVHAATAAASAVLDWRLFVPEAWDETCVPDGAGNVANEHAHRLRHEPTTLDEAGARKPHVRKQTPAHEQIAQALDRREAAKVPDTERYRPKWLMALEMLDELAGWGLRPPTLVADSGYGQVAEFRQGLTQRGIPYVVATTSSTTAHRAEAVPQMAPYSGMGPHPKPRYRDKARSLKDLARDHGREHAELLPWRPRIRTLPAPADSPDSADSANEGGEGPGHAAADELSGYFFALRVRPAGHAIPRDANGVLPDCWLLVEWPPGADDPTDYWLSTLPADIRLTELVRLAKARWRIEHDYRELKTGLGLDHFEGRSWIGWHRHVTLVTAAQLFLTQLRLENPKAVGQT